MDLHGLRRRLSERFATMRRLGPLFSLMYAISRFLRLASAGRIKLFVYHLIAQPVNTLRSLPHHRGRTIEVREAGPDEVAALSLARPPEVIRARYQQQARCLLARMEGRFLGFLWFLVGPYEEDEVRCLFIPTPVGVASWDFDVFVEPSARFGFTFARLWDEANQILSSQGVKWSISRISAFNPESLAAHKRMGSLRIASAGFLSLGSAQIMIATTRPYLDVSLRKGARPVMTLRAPASAASQPMTSDHPVIGHSNKQPERS